MNDTTRLGTLWADLDNAITAHTHAVSSVVLRNKVNAIRAALADVPAPAVPPDAWEPQFDAISHKQEQLAIQFCAEIAGPLGQKGSPPDPVRLLEMAEALYRAEREDLASVAAPAAVPVQADERFPQTYCSQCGCELGPGPCGLSRCQDHASREAKDAAWAPMRIAGERFIKSQVVRGFFYCSAGRKHALSMDERIEFTVGALTIEALERKYSSNEPTKG